MLNIIEGKIRETKRILDKGVNVNAVDSNGYTPLLYAIQAGNKELVKMLLEHGSFTDQKETLDGDTALHWILSKPFLYLNITDMTQERKVRKEIAMLLLDYGANVNLLNNHDSSPLHMATKAGFIELVKTLITKGSDVNAKNKKGETAIHIALDYNKPEYKKIIKTILKEGKNVDLNIKDDLGMSPIEKAVKYQFDNEIINLLRQEN